MSEWLKLCPCCVLVVFGLVILASALILAGRADDAADTLERQLRNGCD